MKNISILIALLITISTANISAQVFADFETEATTPPLTAEAGAVVKTNPDKSGINTSNNVAYYKKVEGNWHYLTMDFAEGIKIGFNNTLTFKVNASTQGRIFAKFWNNGEILIESWAPYWEFMPTPNTWVLCEMDMSSVMQMEFDKLEIAACVDNDAVTDVYLDDFELSNPELGDGSPKVNFTVSSTKVYVADELTFDASESFDYDGEIVSYQWTFGNGASAEGKIVKYSYAEKGTYSACITLTDNEGKTSSDSVAIFVLDQGDKLTDLYRVTVNPEVNKKLEFTFQVADNYSNSFNPDEVKIDALVTQPNGNTIVVPCFFYKKAYLTGNDWNENENLQSWMLRILPPIAGDYSIQLKLTDSDGSFESAVNNVSVNSSSNYGIVKNCDNNNQYYKRETGELYFPMGINIGWNNITNYTKTISNLGNANANTFRYWHTPFANQALEWKENSFYDGLGFYSQAAAGMTDSLLDLSAALNMNMQLVIFQHGMFSENVNEMWEDNPYNVKNGGFIERAEEYFYSEPCKAQTKKLLRYIVARWGYSPNLFAWEFFNEVQFTGIHNEQSAKWKEAVYQWHSEMSQFVSELDPYNHLQTTSADHKQVLVLDTIKSLDIVQYHLYDNKLLESLNEYDLHFNNEMESSVICGEYGTNVEADLPYDMQMHAIWNGIMTQTPRYMWIWEHYLETAWANLFTMPAAFVKDVEFANSKRAETLVFNVTASTELKGLGLHTDTGFYGYVYSESNATKIEGAICNISSLPYANYKVSYYLPEANEIIVVDSVPLIKLTNKLELPKFSKGIAIKIEYLSKYTLPIAIAGNDTIIAPNVSVTFSGELSLSQSSNTLGYLWNLDAKPAASAIDVKNVEDIELTIIPDVPGIYKLSLVVNDGISTSEPDVLNIVVSSPPVAIAGNDTLVHSISGLLKIDGSASYDPDGHELSFLWKLISFPDDSRGSLYSIDQKVAQLKVDAIGDFVISLTVFNGISYSSDTVTVTADGLGVSVVASDLISVYPNPTKAQLIVRANTNDAIQSLVIYDITGSVLAEIAGENKRELHIAVDKFINYSGIFMMRIKTGNALVNKRFVFEK